jgi:hypothetical protein
MHYRIEQGLVARGVAKGRSGGDAECGEALVEVGGVK